MQADFIFAHDYEVHLLDELPTGEEDRRYYYPGGSQAGGKDGLLVRVVPHSGTSWIGVFEFGNRSSQVISGVWSHPDPSTVCVVSRAKAYLVDVGNPELWSEISSFPVTSVVSVSDEGLLLFADLTEISAYSSIGLVWRSRPLSWDGLEITSVESGRLFGLGHDPTLPAPVAFAVDLRTGLATGGSSSELYKRRPL